MTIRAIRAAAVALVLAAPASAQDWRGVATPADRARMGQVGAAWRDGLADARTREAAAVANAGALLDPAAARPNAMPPAGAYRCRVLKLGARTAGMPGHVAYPWFACRVWGGEGVRRFVKLTGSQRQVGRIYPARDDRAAFLGTLQYGYERQALAYGRDRERDVAGWVERIGPRRWRIAMPYPAFESLIDVMELVPAD